MTYEQYFEGLGCSPDEVQICSAVLRADGRRNRDLIRNWIKTGRICIYSGEPSYMEGD